MLNRLIGIGIALAFCQLANAQLAYRFRNFSINDGLSQSSVTCIVQDEVGTLWVGTQDGINRFDGQQFQVFNSDNTSGLESGYIHASHRCNDGTLWFGTSNGLTAFNPQREVFHTFGLSNKSSLSIEEIAESVTGDLYLATTTQGLAVWNKIKRKVDLINTKIPSKRFHYLRFLTDHLLLISTEDRGVFTYNIKTKAVQSCVPKKWVSGTWMVNDVESFSSSVYLLSTNKGLWLYDVSTNNSLPFLTEIEKDFGIIEIADVYLNSTAEFYVATQNKGLLTVRKEGGTYTIFQSKQDIFQKDALLFDEINKLFCDRSGAIWVGTLRGLSCFNPSNKGFLGVGPSGNLKQGLPSSSVWGFAEDPTGKSVFIASDFAVSHLNRRTGLFDQYYITKGADNDESSIMSLYYVNDHELLVGCTDGLYDLTFHGSAYSVKKIPYKKVENPSSFEKVYRILAYEKDQYLLATKGGVLLFNKKKNEFKPFVYDAKNPKNSLGAGICRMAFKGIDGTIYFGTSEGGLSVLKKNPKGDLTIAPFKWNTAISKTTQDYVTCMYQDNPFELWLGTTGSGILQVNTQ
jgi:ligand-binding sensor domain-containing protein